MSAVFDLNKPLLGARGLHSLLSPIAGLTQKEAVKYVQYASVRGEAEHLRDVQRMLLHGLPISVYHEKPLSAEEVILLQSVNAAFYSQESFDISDFMKWLDVVGVAELSHRLKLAEYRDDMLLIVMDQGPEYYGLPSVWELTQTRMWNREMPCGGYYSVLKAYTNFDIRVRSRFPLQPAVAWFITMSYRKAEGLCADKGRGMVDREDFIKAMESNFTDPATCDREVLRDVPRVVSFDYKLTPDNAVWCMMPPTAHKFLAVELNNTYILLARPLPRKNLMAKK